MGEDDIIARITRPRPDLVITRIPKKTLDRWHEFASQEEFCKDFGFALKYLIDFHDGIIMLPEEKLLDMIAELQLEVNELKSKVKPVSEDKKRTMMNGRRIE